MAIVNASTEHPPASGATTVSREHKKKKKRRREEDGEVDAGDGRPKDKRKKKRSKHSETSADPVEQEEPGEGPSETVTDIPTPSEPSSEGHKKSKKSKKKDKGKQKESVHAESSQGDHAPSASSAQHQDPDLEAAASLLSVLVAAASNSPDAPSAPANTTTAPFHPGLLQGQASLANLGYPFAPYGPVPPGHFPHQHPPMHPALFPTPNAALNELSFGSNEDVLRALQALDMSKITHAFRTLDAPIGPDGQPAQLIPAPRQGPSISIQSDSRNPAGHKRTLDMALPGKEHLTTPDHAWALANKWMNASKLAELVRSEGLVYRKGKFSAIEEQQLKAAIDNYKSSRGFSEDQMQDLIFPSNEKNRDTAFWSEITSAVSQRPIIAVYHHVRRIYHPFRAQGKWSSQEDQSLKQAVADLGQQWEKVSHRVGRMSSDCRDRWRNHLANRDQRVTGPWSKEEEEELTRIVTDLTVKQGRDIDNDVFWGRVSELMGGRRGRQQCRIKWTDALSKTVKNDGQKPRWSQQDAYILIHKVDALDVRDDTEIDWKTLPDPSWHLWSAHTLQRRWLTMKRGIKGFEDMTHHEIMDILRVKKAQPPAPPTTNPRKRKPKKVLSSAAVVDDAGGEGEASTSRNRQEDPDSETDSDDGEEESAD